MKKTLAVTALAAFAGVVAFTPTKTQAAGYGMAGCGLGAIVIGPKPGIIQVVGATLNGTSANQTFAITTGTSECTDGGAVKAEMEQRVYMAHNISDLQQQFAQGEGEKVSSLAYLMGCSADSQGRFAEVGQANFDKIFNAEEKAPEYVLHRLKETIAADSELGKSCKKVWL